MQPTADHEEPANFWGKLSEDKQSCLALAYHCIDVACVFRALCELPAIKRSLPPLDTVQLDRLAVFAFLHDLGKCNAGFQAKRDPNARNIAGHDKETAALLHDEELTLKASRILGLDSIQWSV